MKTKFAKLAILFFALSIPFFAFASVEPGIKPGSIFYFFDILAERTSLFFTFDKFERAKKAILQADERIAEIKASESNPKAIVKAANGYKDNLSKALDAFAKIDRKEQKAGFLLSFSNRSDEHRETLISAYNDAPEENKETLKQAVMVYVDGIEQAREAINNLIAETEPQPIAVSLENEKQTPNEKIAVLHKEVERLKQQKPQSAADLKRQDPQQYATLVNENKNHLQELNKSPTNKQIIAGVKPAVVYIEVPLNVFTIKTGSGMNISSDGYILTNAHVVSGANFATVTFFDGRKLKAEVAGRNEKVDIAILKVSAQNLPTVELANSNHVEQGDGTFVFGYPFGIEGDVSFDVGVIKRRLNIDGLEYFEISNEIHHGNSGGPLVNDLGQVIGINTRRSDETDELGALKYALPINTAKDLIPDLKAGRNIVLPKIAIPDLTPTPSSTPIPIPEPSPSPIPKPLPQLIPQPKPEPVRVEISSVSVFNITANSVDISWETNVRTDIKLEYRKESGGVFTLHCAGPFSSYCSYTNGLDARRIHNYTITGLDKNTTHVYRITAISADLYPKEETVSELLKFKTDPGDVVPPTISSVNVFDIKAHAAKFSFNTNEPTTVMVEHGLSDGLELSLLYQSDTLRTSHSFGATSGFKEGVVHYYRIIAVDESGNKTTSEILNFKTPKVGFLSIANVPFPDFTLLAGSKDAEMFKIRATASADEDIKINKMIVSETRPRCGVESVSLYADNLTRSGQFVLDSAVTINLDPSLVVPAGSYKDIVLKVNISSGANGESCSLNLQTNQTGFPWNSNYANKYGIDAIGVSSGEQIYVPASGELIGHPWTIK